MDNIQKKHFWINQPLQTKGLIQGVCTPACKNIDRGSTLTKPVCRSRQSLREMRFLTTSLSVGFCRESEQDHQPPTLPLPSFKTVFTFLDIKTHKLSLLSAFNIRFHLTCEKDRRGLMGKAVLYTTVLKTPQPPQPFTPPK